MKKKIIKQPNVSKSDTDHHSLKTLAKHGYDRKSFGGLFQQNYQLIAKTINQTLQKPNYSAVITKILEREPSIELISFQQMQKNLVFQQYLQQYNRLDKYHLKIKSLVPKHLPNVKANYMDFKIKNFLILNKYKVTDKPNLPYPLCLKFQKLTDSKMSSTKSVQNKVLHQLQQQIPTALNSKRNNICPKPSKVKKNLEKKLLSTERFEIKALTQSIGEMIQNIKDVRALQNFKKQMEKSSQFKFGITNFQEKQTKFYKKSQTKQILKIPKKPTEWNIKEKQFKKKVQDQMMKNFPEDNKNPFFPKKISNELNPNIPLIKAPKGKFSFKSQRLQTNPDPDIEEYGLSIIRQRRKKTKSRECKSKSKSRDNSKRSHLQSSHQFPLNNKRLETQYSQGSTKRLNTGYQNLAKSKSSSRIPTEYDSTVIVKGGKYKNKQKEEAAMFANLSKKDSKSSSISSQVALGFKKSKSKSKLNLLQFNSPNKIPKK